MICATCASCWPRPLFGNVTGSAGAPSSAALISCAERNDVAEHAVGRAHQLQAAVEGEQPLQRREARVHRRRRCRSVCRPNESEFEKFTPLVDRARQEQRVAAVHGDARRQRAGVQRRR